MNEQSEENDTPNYDSDLEGPIWIQFQPWIDNPTRIHYLK